ncbi:unnamed protein product [Discosporangium mesarthrocarpum]
MARRRKFKAALAPLGRRWLCVLVALAATCCVVTLCTVLWSARKTSMGDASRLRRTQESPKLGRPTPSVQAPGNGAELPYVDLVVAVLVVGNNTVEGAGEIERVRRVYGRYEGRVSPDEKVPGVNDSDFLTFRYVLVVDASTAPEPVPEEGLLRGEYFYVNVRPGYQHLSDKTLALMALSEHMRFRFLAKTDGDTFPCLRRVASQLLSVTSGEQGIVYAGLLATCGRLFPPGHKLHDPEFEKATGGVLTCHPMYHQLSLFMCDGAFYVLGHELVDYLHASRYHLQVMSVEDAMVGLWLLGIKKVILDTGGNFYCLCATQPAPRPPLKPLPFYHFCKTDEKINKCVQKMGSC